MMETIACCAERALLYEVAVTPKPGLVDRADNGAHRDMDFFCFLDSAAALRPYFARCAEEGRRAAEEGTEPEKLLSRLRGPGKEAEEAMRRATGGVNTHKGAVFLLGLLSAAAGREMVQGRRDAESILYAAGQIAAPVLRDFSDPSAAGTAGMTQYRENGCTGIRGEAAAGFPAVKNTALPVLKKALAEGKSVNDAGVEALLALILSVDDTTLIKRCGSREAAEAEKAILRDLLLAETPMEAAARLNTRWSEKGFSAGGCADLLGAAYFLLFIGDV